MEFWNQKTFCLVSGASKGIGRTIAIEFSKKVAEGSLFVLVARTTSALESTKASILELTGNKVKVVVATLSLDKPEPEVYYDLVNNALVQNGVDAKDFDHSILVHNAGSLGKTEQSVVEWDNLKDLQEYFTFNVFSMILLNSQFFKIFNDSSKQRSVVQITSLSALQPMKTWGFYSVGKAARDILMKSLALESDIQVISWSPGPVDTDMYDQACKATADPDVNKMFNESRDEGKILTTEQTITKLVRVLGEKKYVKGEHVDYYDV